MSENTTEQPSAIHDIVVKARNDSSPRFMYQAATVAGFAALIFLFPTARFVKLLFRIAPSLAKPALMFGAVKSWEMLRRSWAETAGPRKA